MTTAISTTSLKTNSSLTDLHRIKGSFIDERYPKTELRFRTRSIKLTEISEVDEENNHQSEHLTLSENIRRMARKKFSSKSFLPQQRLKTTLEELSEADDS